VIDINNQQDYFIYYLPKMRKKKSSFNWAEVVKLLLPLTVFALAMVWLGTFIS